MAKVFPFRALRYNPARVDPWRVVTQPYDKITPEMQDKYHAASHFNLVRIILGKREAADNEQNNVYTRAALAFRQWRSEGVLCPDSEPSIYVYWQRFTLPGSAGREYERRGFIALAQLEDYENGVVFRHEQTLSGPKTDRLNLLRATRAHFGQLFMLYSDPAGEIDSLLTPKDEPDTEICDDYGVLHRVWRVSDPAVVKQVQSKMADKRLIIADGHHRYETALNYRNERRADPQTGGARLATDDAPYERVMMTFVNMESEGLVILPTHRVVFGLEDFSAQKLVQGARKFFDIQPLGRDLSAERAAAQLRGESGDAPSLVAATTEDNYLLTSRPGAGDQLLAEFSPRQRHLNVVQLHKLLLEHVLGISEEAIRNQRHINYVRDGGEALARVRAGANAAFLMNPVRMEQVRDIAFAGEVLPQKSTDFYPKLLSGLAIYALE